MPIVKGEKFSRDHCPKNDLGKEMMKNIPYNSVVGSLMYASVCNRLNISYAVTCLEGI